MKNQPNVNAAEAEEINQKILEIKNEIFTNYPELTKFLNEMPVTTTDVDLNNISIKDLKEYYNSLKAMVKKYEEEN